jgi:hypothetical protein
MLIALITTFLVLHFTAHSPAVMGPFQQAEAHIKKDVTDRAHQKEALAIVERMKSEAKAYAQERENAMDALTKLLAKRQTPMSDIERASKPLIADDRAYAEKLVDLRFQLKSVLTASEWAKVFPAHAASHTSAETATASLTLSVTR